MAYSDNSIPITAEIMKAELLRLEMYACELSGESTGHIQDCWDSVESLMDTARYIIKELEEDPNFVEETNTDSL